MDNKHNVGRVFTKSIVGDIFCSNKHNTSFTASLRYRSRMIDKQEVYSTDDVRTGKIIFDVENN